MEGGGGGCFLITKSQDSCFWDCKKLQKSIFLLVWLNRFSIIFCLFLQKLYSKKQTKNYRDIVQCQ